MSTTTVPAPRDSADALRLWLARYSTFPEHFRRDKEAQCWRRRDEVGLWRPAPELSDIVNAVRDLLTPELVGDPPLVFRCVAVPPAPRDVVEEFAYDLDFLESVTNWDEARAELNYERLLMAEATGTPYRPITGPLITRRQRERIRTLTGRRSVIVDALKDAGAMPECWYSPTLAPVEVDPTAWLNDVTEAITTATIGTRKLHAAYVKAVASRDPLARPMGRIHFRRIAERVFGSPARHTERGDVYEGRTWSAPSDVPIDAMT